jgi:6-pyruvoyltetrahydropterin/6-carboxytetrahydropterin synthase
VGSAVSYRITKSFAFDAAHRLPNVPPDHKCSRVHGHGYKIILGLEGELDEKLGWVQDYGVIKQVYEPLRKRLDHHDLNEIPGLENPTAEILARWLYERLAPQLPLLVDVTVCETDDNVAVYRPGG